ncbi:hypothetical protein QU891_26080, partial [Klebsiella pneumoniae]
GTVCVVGKMRDLILQLSKSSIYSTKPHRTKCSGKNSILECSSQNDTRNGDDYKRHRIKKFAFEG